MLRASVWLTVGLALTGAAYAQDAQRSPVLTLNQDRLYVSSEFGQRVQAALEASSAELAAENRKIETALIEEERRLTEERPSMEPAEFRLLAEDFDVRVTGIRGAQDAKRASIQRAADAERARFFELAFPVLLKLVEDSGAVAILNDSAVIFSVRQIDITNTAIARVNEEIGAAPLEAVPSVTPQPRPAPAQEN